MELIIVIAIIWYVIKKATENEARQKNSQNNSQNNIWDNISHETQRQSVNNTQRKSVSNEPRKTSAMKQVHEGRKEARDTTILQRAKANAEEDKVDETLVAMEAEHNHSERVAPAIHHHPEDEIPESMLGSVEDLIVKGYDGNLCFERDFVGEGLDMISHFTV